MKPNHPTGLGDPEPTGKLALFRPPKADEKPRKNKTELTTQKILNDADTPTLQMQHRIRTTVFLSGNALRIIQSIQQDHRLSTGKVLPLWKAISQAIEWYGKQKVKVET